MIHPIIEGFAYGTPFFLTLYLIFFQTQRIWVQKRYVAAFLLTGVFALLWATYVDRQNGFKLSLLPLLWVVTAFIGQLIHSGFSRKEERGAPIVFVTWTRFSDREYWDKRMHRKPTNMDRGLSLSVVLMPFLLLLVVLSLLD